MNKPILIFPAGMPRSLTYLEQALAEGVRVIGSSSLGHDPARERYPEWAHLPYVTEPEFETALSQVIADFDIGGIYTPNPVVWDYLSRCIAETFPGVVLVNPSPVASEVAPYVTAMQFGMSVLEKPLLVAADGVAKPLPSVLEIAALYRHSESIPGMCDHEKVRALCEIFRYAPQGDVVEIGCWWGKSAFILARLALCHRIGNLLCVDPWSNEHLIQRDERGLVDRVPADAEQAMMIFQMNLIPYASGAVNYLRMPSVLASSEYRSKRPIESPEFGLTDYSHHISILHIDGNHSYESALADVDAWAGMVTRGGWIVIDDYLWPYGDGPKRVGDELLKIRAKEIVAAFVMGGALFLQFAY